MTTEHGYRKIGINDLDLSKRIIKFFNKYAKIVQKGQGQLTIECEALWEMSPESFEKTFGITYQEPTDYK